MRVREEQARGGRDWGDGLARAGRLARPAPEETEQGGARRAVASEERAAARERAAAQARAAEVAARAVRLVMEALEPAVSVAAEVSPASVETGALVVAPARPAVGRAESRA
jgi:hypothetical protein